MTDHALRTLERASLDDPRAAVQHLRALVRAGKVERMDELCPGCANGRGDSSAHVERPADCALCGGTGTGLAPVERTLELLAYVGHEPARVLVDQAGVRFEDHLSLSGWLHGLERWGQAVMVRAAVAAGWAVNEVHRVTTRTEHALMYAMDPVIYATRAWKEAAASRLLAPSCALRAAEAWLEDPSEANRAAWRRATPVLDTPLWATRPGRIRVDEVKACANVIGDAAVRAAIRDALVAWALVDD